MFSDGGVRADGRRERRAVCDLGTSHHGVGLRRQLDGAVAPRGASFRETGEERVRSRARNVGRGDPDMNQKGHRRREDPDMNQRGHIG